MLDTLNVEEYEGEKKEGWEKLCQDGTDEGSRKREHINSASVSSVGK
jgi:hypothetical protein